MTAELTLYFENAEDLQKVMQLLRETGLEILTLRPKPARKKLPKLRKREWVGIGSVNLGNTLSAIDNLRDFAHE
ncbi:MAG: hypothetical protein H6574_00985 [Lewinellaceae bacterium]|nr:hypothetical protein [Lewinellaceae bacterium]